MFYEQLQKLCKENGIKPTPLVKKLGMSSGAIQNWKDGKLPSGEILVRFSEFFNVSLDYLVYGKETLGNPISSNDSEWLSLIHRLPEHKRNEFKLRIEGYLECYEEPTLDKTGTDSLGK